MDASPTSLDRLHDLVAPLPVPWWPPAPAWDWILAAAALVILTVLARGFLRWQHNRYRREALAEWRRQKAFLSDAESRAAALAVFAQLLKRAALSAFPRREVAALTGPAWFDFLDRTGRDARFGQGFGALLEAVAYDPRSAAVPDETQAKELAALVRGWLAHHHAETETGEGSRC